MAKSTTGSTFWQSRRYGGLIAMTVVEVAWFAFLAWMAWNAWHA